MTQGLLSFAKKLKRGDLTPITHQGRIVGIILMVVGIAMFWSYTALFAEALLAKEIDELEHSIQNLESLLKENKQHQIDSKKIQSIINSLQKSIDQKGNF